MIIVDEILTSVSIAMDLAKKHQDKETAEKLVEIYSSLLELKKENQELRKKIEALEKTQDNENDLELSDDGFYYKISEITAGKKLRYCAACYNNTGKLHPITQGSMSRSYFCTNCKMHYNGWQIPKL